LIIEINDEPGRCISDPDLAKIAEWASKQIYLTPDREFRKCFSLLREGADTLLRRRALALNYQIKKENT
jgi:hypothetical protein